MTSHRAITVPSALKSSLLVTTGGKRPEIPPKITIRAGTRWTHFRRDFRARVSGAKQNLLLNCCTVGCDVGWKLEKLEKPSLI